MVRLSVNVNKIATLRNSRTPQPAERSLGEPRVLQAAEVCLQAGAQGITVHPRPDARHITLADVRELAVFLKPCRPQVELNIEGDPRPELVDLVLEVVPEQFTLVPVRPGEVTSQAGWPSDSPTAALRDLVARVHDAGIRTSLFVDPEPEPIRWAADVGAARVELFTEPFARAFEAGPKAAERSFARYCEAARLAHELGLGLNAGHDLDLDNLVLFRGLPHLDEVSIGHAIVARAVFDGLGEVVRQFLAVLGGGTDEDTPQKPRT